MAQVRQLGEPDSRTGGYFSFFAAQILRDFHSPVALSRKAGMFRLRAELAAAEVVIPVAADQLRSVLLADFVGSLKYRNLCAAWESRVCTYKSLRQTWIALNCL
jgi:hypothetical protein